jgi:hypothetical protein
MRKMNRSERGIGLLEAMLVSCLVIIASYVAVNAKLSLSFVAAGTDSRAQVSKAVKEYSNLLYQVAGDLDVARGRSFVDWQVHVQAICREMVNESERISGSLNNLGSAEHGSNARSMMRIWHENFNSAVSFMNFKLTDCQTGSPTPGLEYIQISVGYQWQDFQGDAQNDPAMARCAPGFRCERFYLSVVKPT